MIENNNSKSMSLDEFIEHLKKGEIPKEALRKEKNKGKIKYHIIPIEEELKNITEYYKKIFNDSIGQETPVYNKDKVKELINKLYLINETIKSLKKGRISNVNFKHLWSNAKNKLAPNELTTHILFSRYKNIDKDLKKHYTSWKRQQNAKWNRYYEK